MSDFTNLSYCRSCSRTVVVLVVVVAQFRVNPWFGQVRQKSGGLKIIQKSYALYTVIFTAATETATILPVRAKLHYTDTGYGHVVQHHQRTSS